jgi:hypothetical protein
LHGDGLANEYYTHGSQTKKTSNELTAKLDEINVTNFTYLNEKWGDGWRETNPYLHPMNQESIPISYTSYDLNFVRKKYLGF